MEAEEDGGKRMTLATEMSDIRREANRLDGEIFRAVMDFSMTAENRARPEPMTKAEVLALAEQRKAELKAKIDAMRAAAGANATPPAPSGN